MYGPTHCQSIQQIPLQGIGTSQPVATFRSPCKSGNFLSTDKGPTARIRGHSYGIHQGKTHINCMSGEYHGAQDWPRQFPRYCTGKGFGNGLTEVTFEPNTFNIWLKGGLIHHPNTFMLAPEQVTNRVQQAYKHYLHLKADKGRWDTWLADLLAAQATTAKQAKMVIWKCLWSNKCIQNNAWMNKWAMGSTTCTMVLLMSQAHIQKTPKYAWNQQLKASWNSFAYQRQVDALPKHPTTLFCNCHCWISSWRQTYTQWPSTKVLAGTFQCPPNMDPMACWLIQALLCPSMFPLIPTHSLEETK